MTAKSSITPLEAIEFICVKTMDNDFDGTIKVEIKEQINVIANLLDINPVQALLVSVACKINLEEEEVVVVDFATFFKSNPFQIFKCVNELNDLVEKGILETPKKRRGVNYNITTRPYIVSEQTSMALLNNTKLDLSNINIKPHDRLSELIYSANSIIETHEDTEGRVENLYNDLYRLTELNIQFSTINYLLDNNIISKDLVIFYKAVLSSLKSGVELDIESAVRFLEKPSVRRELIHNIIEGDIMLISHDLIEVETLGLSEDSTITLTNKAKGILSNDGLKIRKSSVNSENIIDLSECSIKELFYNPEDVVQMETLNRILEDNQFTALQERLKEKGMSAGLPILLYGGPGTGKTESVYQFAKKSGRKLMKVDMSETKSKWFGESEKVVKQIFTKYYEFANSCKVMPILFLNEADALLSNRKNDLNGNVDKTEHTIQNILLDEMENFKGIMFATTNHTSNLDRAFDRRFLYKIELNNPKPEVSAKIWQSKLSSLSIGDCLELANKFSFSGGQIDNIARKFTVMELLNNITPSLEEVKNFCKEELLAKNKMNAIGFQNSKL